MNLGSEGEVCVPIVEIGISLGDDGKVLRSLKTEF